MGKKHAWGVIYGLIHFSVEVASFYFLFARMRDSAAWWVLALFFDAVAFLPQGILGIITDRFLKCNMGLLGGLLMIAALLSGANALSLFFLALGNAMIHVAGAQHTLRGAGDKIAPNALFVGGGSVGVITGQLLGAAGVSPMVPLVLMVLSCVAMWICHCKDDISAQTIEFAVAAKKPVAQIVLCVVVGVAVRSYTAYAIPTDWSKTAAQAVALFVCMGLGKAMGGFLCDRIGCRRVVWISLLGGLPFLLAGNTQMVLSLIGVALFSMTMPVSVAVLASIFPRRPGFAFGITTMGLFLGAAPAFFIRPQTLLAHQILIVVLTAAALPAFMVSIRKGVD